jgi:hypothetical protein
LRWMRKCDLFNLLVSDAGTVNKRCYTPSLAATDFNAPPSYADHIFNAQFLGFKNTDSFSTRNSCDS